MLYGLKVGQVRQWNDDKKWWFSDKSRSTFLITDYNSSMGDIGVYEPNFKGHSRYTPEYLHQSSHEVKDDEGKV